MAIAIRLLLLAVTAAALPMRPDLMFEGVAVLDVEAPAWPGPLLAAMQDSPPGSYLELLTPLVHAVGITYASSSGPSHVASEVNATIPGGRWERFYETEADPASGGVHGRTFVDHAAKRVIVAFRGICKDDSFRQCQVDNCFLQSISAFGALSKVAYSTSTPCDEFSKEFDYVRQADAYVRNVQARLPGYDMVVTGHSMGGAMAIVTAAQQVGTLKAVTFAPTAFHELLRRDAGLSDDTISSLPSEDLVAIGDPFDEMINAVYVQDARKGATTCLLEGLEEPRLCEESMMIAAVDPASTKDVAKTLLCKGAAHDWPRYNALLLQTQHDGTTPAHLPSCSTENSVFKA